MKAQELKIGNWVSCDVGLIGLDPHKLQLGDFADMHSGRLSCDVLHPIPLTEEWLEKFGFKKLGENVMIKDHKLKFVKSQLSKGATGYSSWFQFDNSLLYNIKYIHQLQNLYFALTGEELEIK